jgi:hypothetical protein
MFSKANIISTIVTTIWGFAGGYLLWGLVGDPYLQDHLGSATGVMKEMPDMLHLVLGTLIQGFAFSTIYSKWANGTFSASNGLNFGLWIAILIGIGGGLINFATSNMLDLTGTLANAVIYIIFFVVMGALAGLVYNKAS